MAEQFSIEAVNANNIPITNPQETRSEEGYLKDLTIEGILELLVAGIIQTSTGRWFLDLNGFRITSFDDMISPTTGSAVEIFRASTTLTIGQLLGRHDTFTGDEWLELRAEDYFVIGKLLGSDWVKFTPNGVIVNATTEATSKDTGALIVEGGVGIEKNAYIGGLLNAPSVTIKPITDSDSPYTVLATDTHIAVDNNASAVTVNLPTGTDGRKVTIYDRAGTASLGTITINRASTNTINGSTSTTLTSNYQSVTLVFYSGNWTII